jgi:MauM/NapG family ferredoxin protein
VSDNSGPITGNKKPAVFKPRRKWHHLRLAVQILTFLLFIFLLLVTLQENTPALNDLFFRLDPLVAISSMIASRSWIAPLALGFVTLLLTIVLGRFWCSWLCPLGSLLDWLPSRHPRKNKIDLHPFWRQGKYFLLAVILLSAIFGSLTPVFLDPITLLFRTVTSTILPAIDFTITTVETWLYNVGFLQPAVDWTDNLLRGWLLTDISFYLPNLAILFLFLAVVGLNAVYRRFWCRYLCPLGALLGLASMLPFIRHRVNREKCISCGRCSNICHTAAISPAREFIANHAECTTCMECVDICPTRAISFTGHMASFPGLQHDPSRRHFLASLGAAAVGTAIIRIIPFLNKTQSELIRPPGSNEERLANQCIRCGECVKVCPTGVLQPSSSTGEWDSLWTPRLMTRLGYCDYSCNSCGQVCPSGAILDLPLTEKRQTVIGIARIDRERCIPWAEGKECIVCEEMCPVPQKAIRLNGQGGGNHGGRTGDVRLPHVREHQCIGCGICEYQCPVEGEAAIKVFPVYTEEPGTSLNDNQS